MNSVDVKPIDLSLAISESIPSFPGSPTPQFIRWSDIENDGYNLELLFLSSHTGTHIDAPYHFVKNSKYYFVWS
jgi:kynurenine formamidase